MPGKMVYHMYIMASGSGALYIGVTSFLERRVTEHKLCQVKGFSQRYKTHKLVYFEPFGDVRNAIAREKQLKRWRREKKVFLIERKSPLAGPKRRFQSMKDSPFFDCPSAHNTREWKEFRQPRSHLPGGKELSCSFQVSWRCSEYTINSVSWCD
jgi:putative endonuclease